jgi:hypothetical protein
MSQTQSLFPAGCKVTTLTATTSPAAAATKQLSNGGSTARLVNLSTTDGAYVAFGDTAANATAVVPADGSTQSCWVGPGADFTVSIPGVAGGTAQFASAISATGVPSLLIYVNAGS